MIKNNNIFILIKKETYFGSSVVFDSGFNTPFEFCLTYTDYDYSSGEWTPAQQIGVLHTLPNIDKSIFSPLHKNEQINK